MPGRRRPAATVAALAVLTLGLVALLIGPFASLATAFATPAPAAAGPAVVPEAPPPANGPRIELRVGAMTPRVVTSAGPSTLIVTGEVVNTGSETVRQVQIRAQRGDRLRTEGDIRTALAGNAADDAVTPAFADVTDKLAPGQRHPVQLTMPLRGSTGGSLALQRSGVYELLINVNGTPEDGSQIRLAGLRMLLPVLGVPAAAGRAPEATETTGAATPVTVVYPLADQPHRLPTGPGEAVVLGDDTLATSLAQGGRLDGLLGALETAAPAGSPMRDAICLGVDPDLLRTVADMSGGYRVRAADGKETEGKGVNAAAQWLGRVRALAAGRCVVPLPYADADLVALSRAGLDDLARYAVKDGARIAGEILRTPVRTDTSWPADGLLDERSLAGYAAEGGRAVVLSSDAVAVSGRSGRSTTGGTVRVAGAAANGVTGLLADPLVTQAAEGSDRDAGGLFSTELGSGSSGRRGFGALTSGITSTSPAGSGVTLSAQDAIGAVGFRALNASASSAPLLVAPPHRWNTTGADARELLEGIGALVTAGRLTPTRLPEGSDTATSTPSASLVYSLKAGAREVPGTVTARLRTDRNMANDLRTAAEPAPTVGATPAQVFDPVTEGLLRAGSASWRGQPDLATLATKVITDRVLLLRSLVRVLEPPGPYSLGGEEAPLPITLANGLPVEMRVRLALSDTPGLRTEKIGEVRIPPLGRSQLRVNAQLTRSGQFSVEAGLTTASGAPLGVPSRLLLRSTAYGTITLWLTGTAGVLLVILAVRRIVRRLRGGRGGRGEPAGRHAGSQPTPAGGPDEEPEPDQPAPAASRPEPISALAPATTPDPATAPVPTTRVPTTRAPAGPASARPPANPSANPPASPVAAPLGGPARYPSQPDGEPRTPATAHGSPVTRLGSTAAPSGGMPVSPAPPVPPVDQPTRRVAPGRQGPPPAAPARRSRPAGLPPGTPGVPPMPPGPPPNPNANAPNPNGNAPEPPPGAPATPPRRPRPPRTPRR
ncbi:DUF6049 family protein [Pseudonocardia acaciae]|uniref:DUF6049 family protein n=1 Tax=Pseudonocardia acaciae TaxID=551276 RepID=UPI00048E25DC|nr:DUF6049 family protein [Pseudonocardia acaciae]